MKSDIQLISESPVNCNYLKALSSQESKCLKDMLLLMITDIQKLCNDNNITFMLGGGSCLGAIRHQGFIPWDDDLDIMMFRKDYDKLISLCQAGKLGEMYEYDHPDKKKDSKNLFLKIYRKGTLDNELFSENAPFPKGIFIDIFPIDYVPKSSIQKKIHSFISNGLRAIASSVFFSQFPSQKYKELAYQNKETKKIYQYRKLIGNIFGIIPHRKWVYWFDKYNSSIKESDSVTIPTGRKMYLGEIQSVSTFLPIQYRKFEDLVLPIPNDYHTYLSSLYKNYMELPPENKREKHLIYQFKCEPISKANL